MIVGLLSEGNGALSLVGIARAAIVFDCSGGRLRSEAGICARRRTFFSCLAKKRRQKKATPLSVSLSLRYRATCDARARGAAAELNSRFTALRSNSCGQSDHEAWTSFGVHAHPERCASRDGQRGVRHGPSLRSAPNARALRAAKPRPSAAMARVGSLPPCGCACGMRVAGWRLHRRMQPLRDLTGRGCLNGAAQQQSEFCGPPRRRRDAGLPLRNAKGSQTRGRFLCLLSCARKKVGRPPGRNPGTLRHDRAITCP